MPNPIIDYHPAGLPEGSYDVYYYRVTSRGVARQVVYFDRGAPTHYVESVARNLRPGTAIKAICRSRPGGLDAYGSEQTRRAIAEYFRVIK